MKGDSAYALAKENGFSGTIDEWFETLRGEAGIYVGENPPLAGHPVWINTADEYETKEDMTPIKGVDYFTDNDKQELIDELSARVGLYDMILLIDELYNFYGSYSDENTEIIDDSNGIGNINENNEMNEGDAQ